MNKSDFAQDALPTHFIGLDIGGSKTRGIHWHHGEVVADHSVGSTNVQNVSVDVARANMAEFFAHVDTSQITEVFAGAGGVDTAEDVAALTALIAPFVPAAQVRVVHDTRLLLAAAGRTTGVAVIAGTGSAAWGANAEGAEARAGGWGYRLGDEGSGYWLGREAVRYSLRRMDARLAVDSLTEALLAYCGLSAPGELIAHFHRGTTRRYWAAASPVVFAAADNGHEAARGLVAQAASDLADLGATVAQRLGMAGPIILGSGMGSNVPALQEAFTSAMARRGFHDVHILRQDPIFGIPLLVASTPQRGIR